MARQKTKGEPVQFRLPASLDQALLKRCTKTGESRSAWVQRVISDALAKDLEPKETK